MLERLKEIQEVVLIRASRFGDFLCATPAFRAIRLRLPDARITLIGLPFVGELSARSPHLDRFIPFPGFPGMAEQFFDPRDVTRFFRRIQSKRFDLAIQMHGTGVYSNTFALMLGARTTVGFVREGDGPGRLDAALPMPSTGHEVERMLSLTTFLGAPSPGSRTEFPLRRLDHRRAQTLLQGAKGPLIAIHPYARKPEKCWPVERFALAASALQQRHGGTVIILGEQGAMPSGARIAATVRGPCLDLTGKTSLATMGAVLARLSLLLTNDSGPAHGAYAVGCPAVVLFGETNPERWGPPVDGPFRVVRRILPCFPCAEDTCQAEAACLRSIAVEQVVSAAEEIFQA
jgi:ADP-heptose:LPS heptosyltransferase